MGDVVITLPYVKALKHALPEAEIDFLTHTNMRGIAARATFFGRVFSSQTSTRLIFCLIYSLVLLPRLLLRRYEVVIDLQDNRMSRIIVRWLRPEASAAFDRLSPRPAGDRTLATMHAVGAVRIRPRFDVELSDWRRERAMLHAAGWNGRDKLLVLNPAGVLPSRSWPIDNYIDFSKIWSTRYQPDCKFLILGIEHLRSKARRIRDTLGASVIDLVGRTTPDQAFALLKYAQLVLSEDSGLMHMAWVSGVPTIALFGSSRSDWSRPLGAHSTCLDSADLKCGGCMLAECMFGDNRCLTRYTPAFVAQTAHSLLSTVLQDKRESAN